MHERSDETLAEILADIDPGGVFEETASAALVETRPSFLRRSLVAAVGTSALLAAGEAEAATANSKNDIAILQFDLVLEYLQAGLFTEAERLGALKPTTLAWARVVGAHERAHVHAIKGLLGRNTVPSPGFDYGKVTSDEQAF